MKSIAVIGIGNILFKDDGIGVYAAKMLEHNYVFTPPIEIVDGGTLGFNLLHYFIEYDKVFIIDTLSLDDAPGSIYHLPSESILGMGNNRKTVHEVEVTQMLEIASLMDITSDVSVIGIVPKDIESVSIDLTPAIKENFPLLINYLCDRLSSSGIQSKAVETPKNLEQIIASFSTLVYSKDQIYQPSF